DLSRRCTRRERGAECFVGPRGPVGSRSLVPALLSTTCPGGDAASMARRPRSPSVVNQRRDCSGRAGPGGRRSKLLGAPDRSPPLLLGRGRSARNVFTGHRGCEGGSGRVLHGGLHGP